MLALFGSTGFLRADEVQIGVGGTTTNSYLPSYSLYNYSLTQQIYTAEEIGVGACTINSIAFYNGGSEKTRDYTMYLVNTDKETFAGSTDWISVTVADQVFSGSVTMAAATWNVFTLDTPFDYTGGNLAVIMDDNTGSWSSGLSCYVFDATSQAIRVYSDGTNYDPSNPASYSGTVLNVKNQLVLDVTISSGPVGPVIPTGEFGITPSDEFALNDRPLNGWSEPFTVRIYNGGAPTTIEGSLSGSYDENPFYMLIDGETTMSINSMTVETDDAFDFDIVVNPNAPAALYNEEFTLFYATTGRDIITIPVTANLYTAVAPDIVEVPGEVTWASDAFEDTPNPDALFANYNLYGMTEMKKDAVYHFTLNDDYHFHATGGDDFIAVYNAADAAELTAAVEPVLLGTSGVIDDEILLAGEYYLVVASNNISNVVMNRTEIPEATEITYVNPSPANGAMEVEAPVTLAWEGGDNATEYQVLFGTVYPPTIPVLDWTMVDDNYGSYTIEDLAASTQYFWQIKVRNSKGTVSGEVRGFTTTLTAPNTVTASETEIFTDESTLIKWKFSGASTGFSGEITVADGTTTNSYIPVYGLWMDDYTRCEMIYPAEMLEEMEGGEITSLTYYISSASTGSWAPATFNVYMAEVDATTLTAYHGTTGATIVYSGALDGTGSTMTINLDTPFNYSGGNLLVGIEEPTVGTYHSCSFYGVSATGASASGYSSSSLSAVTFNQRNFLPKTTFTCGGRGYQPVANRSFLGFNLYYGQNNAGVYEYTKVNNDLITEKQYLLSGLPYNMDGLDIKVTAVYDEGESGHSTPDPLLVYVSGYGKFTGHVNELISGSPISGVTVKFTGRDEFNNNVSFQGTTNASGAYTINNVKAGNYTGVAMLEGMENAYSEPVTLAYNTTETVDFIMHEQYKPVLSVYAEEIDPSMSKITWSMNTVVTGGGTNTGSASTFTEGFEGGMPSGWTVIDANNDGYTWCLTSAIPSTWTYYSSMTLDWYRTGTNAICSGSYINGVGAITPNDYLVTPQVTLVNGSTFKFWGAATDASYPADHFGVAVSDNGTDWTMVQEWTMTAKDYGTNGGRASRDGNGAKLGSWHEFSVDLSAYAGQKYIAIRHFNCNDQYIMCIDDIELTAGSKDRSVENYTLVRKAILKENDITPADSVTLAENYTDTLYADFTWNNMEPGLYQYGVSAHYPVPSNAGGKGNRDEVIIGEGTGTNSYVPTYNLYNYSCTNQIYTGEEIGGAGTINSIAFMPATVNTASRNLNVYMVNTDKTSFTSTTDWIPVTDADLVYSGTVNWTANTWCTIELTNPFQFDGTNLAVIVNDLTGSWTSSNQYYVSDATAQAIRIYRDASPYDPSAPGTGAVLNVKNNIKLDITLGNGAGSNDDPIAPLTWSNILPKDMDAVVIVNAHMAAGSTEGVAVNFANDFESGYNFVAEMDETGTVTFDDFRKGNYTFSVTLPDYVSNYEQASVSVWNDTVVFDVTLEEIFKPVEVLEVSGTGYARWTNMLPEEPERVAERYHVTLDNIFQGETTDNFMQLNVDGLEVGHQYTAAVAVVYTTGMSQFVTKNFTYLGCEATATQVEDLEGHAECMNVVLTWNGGTAPNPNPNPNPNPGPTTGTTYDFDDGTMMNWTSIDADGDSYGWVAGANIGGIYLVSGASLAGSGHNSSNGLVCSGSYSNVVGALTPNNFLVSPAKGNYSSISFWACGQDASYVAEHFGVAVSTGGATASEFTTVQEWTMTGKDSGAMSIGRDGQTRAQGSWHEYTVDLSAYAGQEIWVAIRHFNCTDMFILDVDDITLSVPEKGVSETADACGSVIPVAPARDMWDLELSFSATSGYQYGVACDGQNIYTSSWSASSTSMFYKYDLQGNFIEEFNISGCGQLRGMTYDGQYFYGVANSSTIYCVDLANHALVSSTNSAYGAMRCITYDPQRDGFWVVGNWSGSLTLVDRSGAIVQAGPTPSSASDVAYFKDDNNEEHVYLFCQPNSDAQVYDYNITTGVLGSSPVFNFAVTPGFSSGISGGCFVGAFNGKTCFFGDAQQSPNLIGIYELSATAGPTGGGASAITPGKFNIFRDGEVIAATNDSYYTYEAEDVDEHLYEVYYVDANYNFSCAVEGVTVAAGTVPSVTDLAYTMEDPYVNLTWEGVAENYIIWRGLVDMTTGQVQLDIVGETTDMAYTDELPAEAGYVLYVVQSVIGDCETNLQEELNNENYILINYDELKETEIVNAIYPNPTSDNLTVKATGMTHISVVNALGQMMYEADVDADEVVLNMGQYNAGIYMVNIVTVNGSTVKRVVVTK